MYRLFTIGTIAALATGSAYADDFRPAMESYLQNEIKGWAGASILLEAITDQNAQTQSLSASEIDALDLAWRAEVGSSDQPTITPVLENAAADFLREQVAASGGAITEIFVMDAQGLNVAASAVTSDFWQGDEAKHQETYGVGGSAVHFGEVEFDESSQTYQGQISVTIVDPDTNLPVGAMTVGVDADALM